MTAIIRIWKMHQSPMPVWGVGTILIEIQVTYIQQNLYRNILNSYNMNIWSGYNA